MRDRRLHPARLLSRLSERVPLLRPLIARSMRRRFDRLAPHWDTIRRDPSDTHRVLGAALHDLAEPPRRLLDVGTGTGQAAAFLLDRYPQAELVGVDVAPAMVARAQEKLGSARARFVVADGARLPFDDASFDLAVALLVQPFARELHRVLAPGGHALVVYPVGDGTPIWFPQARVAEALRAAGFGDVREGRSGRGEWTRGTR